jgi:site-specific DNA-methyltransferase (adenine-specific)
LTTVDTFIIFVTKETKIGNTTKIQTNKFYHADCLDILKELPDKSIDLVLTDPPYGIGINNSGRLVKERRFKVKDWDNKTPEKIYFDEIFRISKNQIIWGGNYFIKYLDNTRCIIVWDKGQPENISFAMNEIAWTSFNESSKTYYKRPQGFYFEHPTQKPVKLFEWCLINYSNENDLILDPFSGSGTTAIACHNLNRRFICIEKDKEYYEKSVLRYENHIKQLKLSL